MTDSARGTTRYRYDHAHRLVAEQRADHEVAYAYDAARLVSAAIRAGAYQRSDVADRMADTTIEGLTGNIRFDAVHERADGGLLFRVERADTGAYELRAQR